jgi:hypothetical protein
MKKLLLVISLVSLAASASAQSCTPGINYADSTYGVWPDTTTNFPGAAANVFYSTDLNFKVPDVVTAEVAGSDPLAQSFIGSVIQDFVVNNVGGLPAGITYACNISNCTYAGGANGCANLFGTATTVGVYPLTIDITATVLVEVPFVGPTPVDVPTSFSGYKIIVGTAGIVEAIINPITVHPNPANDKITLTGLNPQMKITSAVITNMEGKVVKTLDITSTTMDVNLNGIDNGVYFIVVNHAAGTETLKFIKE